MTMMKVLQMCSAQVLLFVVTQTVWKITGFKSLYNSQSEINTSNLSYADKGDAYQMNAITFVLTLQLNSLTR